MGEVTILKDASGDFECSQLLAKALGQANEGKIKDVVMVSTDENGKISVRYAKCNAGDIAVAASLLQEEVIKILNGE